MEHDKVDPGKTPIDVQCNVGHFIDGCMNIPSFNGHLYTGNTK